MQSNSDFTEILERILQSSEGRHFTSKELSALSILCTTQSNSKGLDADLGFSDVDPSTTGQLVEALQTHVALASTVDWVGQGHKAMQQGSDYLSLESVSHQNVPYRQLQNTNNTIHSTRNSFIWLVAKVGGTGVVR